MLFRPLCALCSAFFVMVAGNPACSQIPYYIQTDGLVAFYPFNGNAQNELGDINSSVTLNGATLAADRFNNQLSCFEFDGNDFIEAYITALPFGNQPRTVSFYAKQNAISTNVNQAGSIFHWGEISQNNRFCCLYWPSAPTIIGEANDACNGCSGSTNHQSFTPLPLSEWHLITVTFDGSIASCYIDGVLNFSSSKSYATTFTALSIGRAVDSHVGGEYFIGCIDDIGIWSRALSSTEIAAMYQTSLTSPNDSSNTSYAITPPGIPYQAIARTIVGEPYTNSPLQVRFSLHEESPTGAASYRETHVLSTDEFGLFATNFGGGAPVTGTFSAINWAQTTKFLQVEIDLGEGWTDMGTQQLMSVPYALYAANSQPGPPGPPGPQGIQGINGEAGESGAEGIGILSTSIVSDSLLVSLSNGVTINAGKIVKTYIGDDGITIVGDTIRATSYDNLSTAVNLTGRTNIGISNSTTWICPQGVTQIALQLWGGGGGGGSGASPKGPNGFQGCVSSGYYGNAYTGGPGGQGGSGGYFYQVVDVVPGNQYNILIGAGGNGAPAPQNYNGLNGQNGGATSFHGLYSANGGSGGAGGVVSYGYCAPGANGINAPIVNYNSQQVSISTLSVSTDRSYVPSGYVTTTLTPSPAAPGGSGGANGYWAPSANYTNDVAPMGGGSGQNGYCIITY